MATTSTVPAVRAALVSLVGAGLAGVSVTYGRPMDKVLPREAVWVGDVTVDQRVPVMTAGRKRREESYRVEVTVSVLNARGTLQTADERCFTLVDAIENVVADDPTLGGIDGLIHATVAGIRSPVPEFAAEGPVALAVVEVACLSRLT